ncbi:hypothetical protein SAMN05443634_111126 [Chishuiella changwenlii]|uniref:Uncharacterized protein n=1 Tax=Chishuiella changwenlii TaxID=1434701 RepID=A0A1M7BSJ2_9FLAO|nr:hypothetical protein [Chishuiella changwenlii]SHL57950.1 hypothetical protein SAMN05443634_111126 [Chishuiella changwenlii]
MIVFDFVAYKVYKMAKKGKQYQGAEFLFTACALGMPVTLLLTILVSAIEKQYNSNFVSYIASIGKIPYLLLFTLPIIIVIYIYLKKNLYKVEQRISSSKILRTLDKLPNFLVFVIFWIIIFFTGILIKETIG